MVKKITNKEIERAKNEKKHEFITNRKCPHCKKPIEISMWQIDKYHWDMAIKC
jgi:Zn ribbon nucleic-acid-binding protein